MFKKTVLICYSFFLFGCSGVPLTHSRVTLYDPDTGKKTSEIDVGPTQEWDAATQRVGVDTKIANASERVLNRTADKMPEYLADFTNRIQKQRIAP